MLALRGLPSALFRERGALWQKIILSKSLWWRNKAQWLTEEKVLQALLGPWFLRALYNIWKKWKSVEGVSFGIVFLTLHGNVKTQKHWHVVRLCPTVLAWSLVRVWSDLQHIYVQHRNFKIKKIHIMSLWMVVLLWCSKNLNIEYRRLRKLIIEFFWTKKERHDQRRVMPKVKAQ
jgi:hypothetical protein